MIIKYLFNCKIKTEAIFKHKKVVNKSRWGLVNEWMKITLKKNHFYKQ